MKPLIASLIAFTLLLPLIAANSFTEGYGEYQDSPELYGYVHDEVGHWTGDYSVRYASAAGKAEYYALAADIDGDGHTDILTISGDSFLFYDDEMALQDAESALASRTSGGVSLYDNGTHTWITALQAYDNPVVLEFKAWSWNGTDLLSQCNASMTESGAWDSALGRETAPKCDGDYCYLVVGNYNVNTERVYKMDMAGGCSEVAIVGPACQVVENVPALGDIDGDGRDELVFACDDDDDGNYGVAVIDTNTSYSMYLDTAFSGDGKLDDLAGGTAFRHTQPLIADLEVGGQPDIGMAGLTNAGALRFSTVRGDGTTVSGLTVATTSECQELLQPAICSGSVSGSGQEYLVLGCTNSTTGTLYLWSIDTEQLDDIAIATENEQSHTFMASRSYGAQHIPSNIVCADMDDDDVDELVTAAAIIEVNEDVILGNVSSGHAGYVSLADVDDDDGLEVVFSNGTMTAAYYSAWSNEPPELNGRVFGVSPFEPVFICPDTTLTFTAKQCPTLSDCHYTNDVSSDTERLVSGCGYNATFYNGTASASEPQLSCYYGGTNPISYSVRVYLQDSANTDDYTQYQDITVSVLNDTAICNRPATTTTLVGSNVSVVGAGDELASEADLTYATELITGQSAFIKGLLVLVFSLLFIVALIKLGLTNVFIFAISLFLLWVVLAMIGLIAWVYVMLFGFIALVLGVVSVMIGRGE